jgi:hypothetical protein
VLSQEGRNDGWISVDSATRTGFKGVVPADHAQQIGHDLSLPGLGIFKRRGFNHLEFYTNIVRELIGH